MSTVTRQEPRAPGRAPARSPSSRTDVDARLSALPRRVTTTGAEQEQMEVENPVTGQRLATVPQCTAEDIELAVERARSAQARWKQADWGARRSVLLRFHDLVLDRQDEILDVIQLESGKARRHAFEEIMDAAMNARYYANTAERHLRTRRRRGAFPLLTAAWDHH